MKKFLGRMFLTLLFIAGFNICAVQSKAANKSSDFTYSVDGNTITIEHYIGKSKTVVIPKKIHGKKVTKIGSNAFKTNYYVEKLVIPEGVEEIENMALYDMESLKSISLPSTLKKLSKESGLNYYSMAAEFPQKTYTVVKGSPAFKFIVKNYSHSPIKVKKSKKTMLWFEETGDKNIGVKSYKTGKKYKKLPTPTKKGYKFLGWYTKKKGGKKVTGKSKANKSQIIYAHWQFINNRAMLDNPRYNKNTGYYEWDTIKFGKCEWLVLSVQGNEAFVVSKYLLQGEMYNMGKKEECTWATSTVRSWLNKYPATENTLGVDFQNKIASFWGNNFTDEEGSIILDTEVKNGGATGNNTIDKVFLLSAEEYNNPAYYLSKYNCKKDINVWSGNDDYNTWWLRDMSDSTHVYVVSNGSVSAPLVNNGETATKGYFQIPYIRPALRLDLTNEALWSLEKVTISYD